MTVTRFLRFLLCNRIMMSPILATNSGTVLESHYHIQLIMIVLAPLHNLSWFETDLQNVCYIYAGEWYHRQNMWPRLNTNCELSKKKLESWFLALFRRKYLTSKSRLVISWMSSETEGLAISIMIGYDDAKIPKCEKSYKSVPNKMFAILFENANCCQWKMLPIVPYTIVAQI